MHGIIIGIEHLGATPSEHTEENRFRAKVFLHGTVVIQVLGGEVGDGRDHRPRVIQSALNQSVTTTFQYRMRAPFVHEPAQKPLDHEGGGGSFLCGVRFHLSTYLKEGSGECTHRKTGFMQDVRRHAHGRGFAIGTSDADYREMSGRETVPESREIRFYPMPRKSDGVILGNGLFERSESAHPREKSSTQRTDSAAVGGVIP